MEAIVTVTDEENRAAFNRLQINFIWGSHSRIPQVISMCCFAGVQISTMMSMPL